MTRVRTTSSPAPTAVVGWSDEPVVSVVMVTYGTPFAVVTESLQRLARSFVADDIEAEVIVVDNAHPELGHRCADRIALATSGIRLIRAERNLGFGGGNELGLAYARADVVCLMNPDLMVHDGWLAPLLALRARHPDAIVAPRLIDRDGTPQEAGQRVLASGATAAVRSEAPTDRLDAFYASAACWIMAASVHERAGGFDPRFHPAYFEDVDLALRVRRCGGSTIVADDIAVVHDAGRSTPDTPQAAERQREVFVRLWADELERFPTD